MGRVTASDAELVQASRRGERAAFGELVERYQRVVCAVGYSTTNDRSLGEDVAQDTFVAAFHQLDQLRDASRLREWLCGIARNLARKARRMRDREDEIDDTQPDVGATPFEAASEHERDSVVAAALERVPETYREALVLYYVEQRSVAAVASALGISADAVHQRLSRGRQLVAAEVADVVEHTLQRRRTRRNLAVVVLAALPVVTPSHANASTGGTSMLKLGIAASIVAMVGTAYAVHRSYAGAAQVDRTAHKPLAAAAVAKTDSGHRPTTRLARAAVAASAPPVLHVAAPLHVARAPSTCTEVAKHLAELRSELGPDTPLFTTESQAKRLSEALNDADSGLEIRNAGTATQTTVDVPPTAGAEHQCLTEHWPQAQIDCFATAVDLQSAVITCTNPTPGQGPSAGQLAAVIDASCAKVASHYTSLVVDYDPATASKLLTIVHDQLPVEIEGSCERAEWSESLRRCLVAAASSDELDGCQ